MKSEVIDRRMIREATLGLVVLIVLLGVLFVTIYLKARVLWATADEDFLATPVTVYQIGQGNVLTPTKKPPLVPLPAIESNQMVDLGDMRTIPAERFADLHSNGNRAAATRLAALDIGPGTGNFLDFGEGGSPGTGNFPELPEDAGPGTGNFQDDEGPGTGNFQEFPGVAPGPNDVEPFDPTGPANSHLQTKSTRHELPSLPSRPEVLEIPDREAADVKSPKLPTLVAQSRVPPVPNSISTSSPSSSSPSSSSPATDPLVENTTPASERVSLPVPGGLPVPDSVLPSSVWGPGRGLLPVPEPTVLEPEPTVPEPTEPALASDPGLTPIDSPTFRVPQSNESPTAPQVRRSPLGSVHAELDPVSPEPSLPDPERNPRGNSRPSERQLEPLVPPLAPPSFSIDDLKNALRRVGLPSEMSMQQLSERLYGDAKFALALMQLNHRRASSDGQFIPGTQIHYLPAEMLAFVYPDLVEAGFTLEQSREPSPDQRGETNQVRPVAYQEATNENIAMAEAQEPKAEWYVTQGGETVFEIAADHLDQASHYVALMQWNRSLLVGRYRPTDPLPKGLQIRLKP